MKTENQPNVTDNLNCPPVRSSDLLAAKYRRRDELLRSVWSIMREISDHDDEAKMSDEDLAVWGEVTAHSAIQSRLDAAFKSQQAANTALSGTDHKHGN